MKTKEYALCVLVKLYRKKLNLSQSELAKDICVPSYLSKIENGEVEPNSQIIRLLLEKMGVQFYDESQFSEEETEIFSNYFKYIFYFRHLEIDEVFERIKAKKKKFLNSVRFLDYLLIEWHYCIFTRKRFKRQLEIQELLETVVLLMSDYEKAIFYFLKAISENTSDRSVFLKQTIETCNNGYYSFQYATTLIADRNFLQSIQHIDNAERLFIDEGNFRGLIYSKYYRGIVYYLLKDYENSEHHFNGIINLLECSNTEDDFIMGFRYFALRYIAYIAQTLNQSDNMIRICKLIIREQEEKYNKVYTTSPYLILSDYYFHSANFSEAEYYLNEAKLRHDSILTTSRDYEIELYQLYMFRLHDENYLKSRDYEKILMNLKKLVFCRECVHFKELVYELLKEFYVANKRYKDAYLIAEKLA